MCIKSLFGILKNPMAYVISGVFFMTSLLTFQYAFASTSPSAEPESENVVSESANLGLISKADITALVKRVEMLSEEKSELDDAWRIERNKHDSMKIRLEDSKKTVRTEMDEVLLNSLSRERLDELLSQHAALAKREKQVAKQANKLKEELAAHQLLLVRANRDLERKRTLYASQQREQDIKRVQKIARVLDRELNFNEQFNFKCSTNKSITACLNDYPLESRVQAWVKDHYQNVLSNELAGRADQVNLSPDWYSAEIKRDFTEANMNLDGTVMAEVDVRANITPRKMMACALLKAPADLCDAQSSSLIVRSNKYGDMVYINGKPYGPTPLSIMLDPGLYNIEVKYQGLTQKRKLTLEENRHLNFVF